ncbi:MAG: ABC transporter permease [Deltaproteobacteria bacterium]|nr:ABC transporter permease [Deltaproteobacteria bacterium]
MIDLLRAELIKVRRSPALFLVLLLPTLLTLLLCLFLSHEGSRMFGAASVEPWRWLGDTALNIWSLIFFPAELALVAAFLASMETRTRGWTMLFTMPVNKEKVYLAKLLVVCGLVGLSYAVLVAEISLGGFVLQWLRPGIGFGTALGPLDLYLHAGLSYLASLFLVSVQAWVALRSRDLVTPLAFGFLAALSLLLLRSVGPEWEVYHPGSYAALAGTGWLLESHFIQACSWAGLGLVGAATFAVISSRSFVRRDFF